MCGISGYQSTSGKIEEDLLQFMCDTIQHRGPDEAGYWEKDGTGLGHRRLSIIDLKSGQQPMIDVENGVALIFNGEIYNFKKLRIELEDLGIQLTTNSDTEVILKGFSKWGFNELLNKLEGMFVFALYELKTKELWIVRDRFGEKPLYYSQNSDGFYFGSELKVLKKLFKDSTIDKDALSLYFQFSYIPAPFTIYSNIKKLEAGKYLKIINGEIKLNEFYYTLNSKVDLKNQLTYKEASSKLKEKLNESVEQRMVSDVPIGSFLSGGIDSSIITALMSKYSSTPVKTFTIGFKEKVYDESDRAELVSKHLNTEHHKLIVSPNDLLKRVDQVISNFDEPFGDSSAIPSSIVSELASEHVKVVLTGDCADELFGGYEKYLGVRYAQNWLKFPYFIRENAKRFISIIPHTDLTNQKLRKIKKVISTSEYSSKERYLRLCSMGFQPEDLKTLLNENTNRSEVFFPFSFWEDFTGSELQKQFYSDVKLVLEGDMLTKVDRASMLNSLETRSPFLDSKLVEFALSLPESYKIQGTNKKVILKETFQDLLPKDTMKFSKMGFGLPLRIWFKNELKDKLIERLNSSFLDKQGLFNADYINSLLYEHFSGKENHSVKLWLLFVFQSWYLENEK
jgi:asparagine synthase (glutamine-hydrolysing)